MPEYQCPKLSPVFWVFLALRSIILYISIGVTVIIWVPCLYAFAIFPLNVRLKMVSYWAWLVLTLIRFICGIRYRVIGREHLAQGGFVVLSRHESAWETLAYPYLLHPCCFVLKKELLKIPLFGWGLRITGQVPINRSKRSEAMQTIVQTGGERLNAGISIVLFPEGTRIAPGDYPSYRKGGSVLAHGFGAKVLPVAVDSGRIWPRNSFIKYPGWVTVTISAPIDITDMRPSEINAAAQGANQLALEGTEGLAD